MNTLLLLLAVTLPAVGAALLFARLRSPFATLWATLGSALVLLAAHSVDPDLPFRPLLAVAAAALLLLLGFQLTRLTARLQGSEQEAGRLREELRRLTTADPLTGVADRREFMRRLEAEMARGRRYRHPTTLVLFDLDHLKELNNQCGHGTGDRALTAFAELVRRQARAEDLVGRPGGGQIGLLLPETPLENAVAVADRIREQALTLRPGVESEHPCRFSVSAGVAEAWMASEFDAAAGLLRRAVLAVEAAKRGGRDHTALYDAAMEEPPEPAGPVRLPRSPYG